MIISWTFARLTSRGAAMAHAWYKPITDSLLKLQSQKHAECLGWIKGASNHPAD